MSTQGVHWSRTATYLYHFEGSFEVFVKAQVQGGKGTETQVKGNELVQADVRVAGYHSTVELMLTTTCVDLDAQLLLFWRINVLVVSI